MREKRNFECKYKGKVSVVECQRCYIDRPQVKRFWKEAMKVKSVRECREIMGIPSGLEERNKNARNV